MFEKTKVRNILELLGKNLSARKVRKVLGVSRSTAAEVQVLFRQSGREWDDTSECDDGKLLRFLNRRKIFVKPRTFGFFGLFFVEI